MDKLESVTIHPDDSITIHTTPAGDITLSRADVIKLLDELTEDFIAKTN